MVRRHSLLRGTLLLSAASLILRGSSMCFQVFLSNRIGAAGIGLLQLIYSVSFLAATLGTAGVRVASMYLTAEEFGARRPGGMRKALLCCLIYGLLVSTAAGIGLFRAASWISEHWIRDLRAASSLRIFAVFLPASCLWSVMSGYFTARSRLRQLVLVEFIDQAISIGATVALLLVWAGDSTERACCSIMLGNGLSTVLTLLLLLVLDLTSRRAAIPSGLQMWRRLIRLCIPLAVSDSLRSGLSTVEHLLIPRGLSRSGSSSETAMASYGTIQGMVFPIMMFPAVLIYSLSDLLVPELAKCRAAKDQRRIHSLSDRCLRMGLIFSAAVAGICNALAEPLGQLLYHSADAGFYLHIFSPLVLILYMDAMVDGMHKGLGQQVFCARVNLITSILDVILLWFLLPRYGVTGYFFCFTITHLLNFYLSMSRLLNITSYIPKILFLLKVLACTAASVVAAQLFPFSSSALSCCLIRASAFLVIFASLLSLASVLTNRDLNWLRSVLSSGKTD